jgi:hypothetical protein
MAQHPEPVDGNSELTRLLAVSLQLKKTAVRARRLDVAAKADEAVALIVDADDSIDPDGRKPGRDAKVTTILRILDGLGF